MDRMNDCRRKGESRGATEGMMKEGSLAAEKAMEARKGRNKSSHGGTTPSVVGLGQSTKRLPAAIERCRQLRIHITARPSPWSSVGYATVVA